MVITKTSLPLKHADSSTVLQIKYLSAGSEFKLWIFKMIHLLRKGCNDYDFK